MGEEHERKSGEKKEQLEEPEEGLRIKGYD